MLGSGQGAQDAAGHAGQALGSGHLTMGQRGRGQGGHSPILHGLEHVEIQGGHLGTEDLRTYLDMSGRGGHSVLSIYLDISGSGGHAGTVDLRTHLLGSGRGQAGQLGAPVEGQPHAPLDFPQPAHGAGVGGGHPHGLAFLQRSQSPTLLVKGSTVFAFDACQRKYTTTTTIRMRIAKGIPTARFFSAISMRKTFILFTRTV
jgi:hypothetical protein